MFTKANTSLLLLLTAFLAASRPIFANTYRGTMLMRVDQAYTMHDDGLGQWIEGIDSLHIGDSFSGWFEYTWTGMDGRFYSDEMDGDLRGVLDVPPILFSGTSSLDILYDAGLVIQDGKTQGFYWGITWGATDANFLGDHWNLGTSYLSPTNDRYKASGEILYGNPVAIPEGMTMTGWLLAAVLAVLLPLGRRTR